MAMNKAEKALLQAAQDELRMRELFALLPRIPPDIPAPTGSCQAIEGWSFNSHRNYMSVSRKYSTCSSHYTVDENGAKVGPGTQGSRALYSTKELAFEAMKRDYAWNAALKLLETVKLYERDN